MEVAVNKTSLLARILLVLALLGITTDQCRAASVPLTVGLGVAAGITGGLIYAHKKIMDYYTDHEQEAMDIALRYDRYHVKHGGLKPKLGICGWLKKKSLDFAALYHACYGHPGRMMAFALYFHNS